MGASGIASRVLHTLLPTRRADVLHPQSRCRQGCGCQQTAQPHLENGQERRLWDQLGHSRRRESGMGLGEADYFAVNLALPDNMESRNLQ